MVTKMNLEVLSKLKKFQTQQNHVLLLIMKLAHQRQEL